MSDAAIKLNYPTMTAGFEDGTHIGNNFSRVADEVEAGYNAMHNSGASEGEAAATLLHQGKLIANHIREGGHRLVAQHHQGHEHMLTVQQIDQQGANSLLG
jgi:hypothetical protein